MFIPVGDTPNPRNFTPWVNWLLIAANVAVYLFISMPLTSRAVSYKDPLLQEYVRQAWLLPVHPSGVSTTTTPELNNHP